MSRVPELDLDAVRAAMRTPEAVTLRSAAQVDSSNSVLLREAASLPDRLALIVDAQQAGRGRLGRAWASPPGANLYLSLFLRLPCPLRALGGFSLALGIACAEAARARGLASVGLKWPNDLVCDGHKLGGLLVELASEREGRAEVVAGLGLNLAMPASAAASIAQPWTDVSRLGGDPDRARWAACMLQALLDAAAVFVEHGLAAFLPRWPGLDVLAGRAVRVQIGDHVVHGTAAGVDASGQLRVHTGDGPRHFGSGEVSVRPA